MADRDALPSLGDAQRGEEAMRHAKQQYLKRALLANGGLASLATPGELRRFGIAHAPSQRNNLHVDVESELDREAKAYREELKRRVLSRSAAARSAYRNMLDDDLDDGLDHGDFDRDFDLDYLAGPHTTRLPGKVMHRLRHQMAELECTCGLGCGLGSGCLHLAALQRTLLGCRGCTRCSECNSVSDVLEMMRTCGQCSHVRQYRDEQGRVMFEL